MLVVFVHIRVYSNIKYHDDGSDLVTRVEFFCMHVPFSFLNGWLSYCVVFTFLQSLTLLDDPKNITSIVITVVSLTAISVESIAYITYYKDIFLSLTIVFCLIGVFTYSDAPAPVHYSALALFIILLLFCVVTLMHSFRSVFYLVHTQFIQTLVDRPRSEYIPKPIYNETIITEEEEGLKVANYWRMEEYSDRSFLTDSMVSNSTNQKYEGIT